MKNTVVTIQQMKEKGEKISMLTAYDIRQQNWKTKPE